MALRALNLFPVVLFLICALLDASFAAYNRNSQDHQSSRQLPAITPGGPNVCRSKNGTYCCPGWTIHLQRGLCIIPICSRTCGTGRCYQPNICLCDNGERKSACEAPHSMSGGGDGSCKAVCMNGGICKSGRCHCMHGYTGDYCTVPVCEIPCKNGGRCIGNNRCSCMYGFQGAHCEYDLRTGPCYSGHRKNLCVNPLHGVMCTKILCCATIGRAWGRPCEYCPSRLECDIGFLMDHKSKKCHDINECEAIPHLCEGGECVNSIGSFDCKCPEGQARNPDTNNCDDRDECQDDGICRNGQCINTRNGFYCQCHPGYIQSQDRRHCLDARQGDCYTQRYSERECHDALSMTLSKRDCCCGRNMGKGWGRDCERCPEHGEDEHRFLCYDIDVMTTRPSNITTYDNRTFHPDSDGLVRVDECSMRPGLCGKGGRCVDTYDGYECVCQPGYRHKKGNTDVCEDINECAEGKCSNGHCKNTEGSFDCICPEGFDPTPDGSMCTDHDECAEIQMCTNGICTNMNGSYRCQCHPGYTLSPTGFACIDIDECSENPRICLNGRCENLRGSYKCHCQRGFVESGDGTYCLDENECENNNMCNFGKCVNMMGSFQCICEMGYKPTSDGHHCVDMNECEQNPCKNGHCTNTLGSFRCECYPGFTLNADGRTCSDIRKDLCFQQYKDGQCLNPSTSAITKSSCCCCTVVTGQPMGWGTVCQACPMPGTTEFDQLCPHGAGSSFDGSDINECAQNPLICQNGACEDLMGTYRCICNPGFKPDETGKLCTDINECQEESMCYGGTCINTPGSFQCICSAGTKLSLGTYECEDVDECVDLGPEICYNGDCINTQGSFKCECPGGYMLDNSGRICIDNRKASCWRMRNSYGACENNMPTLSRRHECCCSAIGAAWGSPCEPCNYNDCECDRGFAKLDGKQCIDINECEMDPSICRGGGTCVNTPGSFTCACPPGLTLDQSGSQCLDLRMEQCYTKCRYGSCMNPLKGLFPRNLCCCSIFGKGWGDKNELCPGINTAAFKDLCPKGVGFVEKKDINECSEFQDMCQNGRCINTIGSYNCDCRRGFAFNEVQIKCLDIDECNLSSTNICGNGACKNLDGSFTCECETGYRLSMQTCMDINECKENSALCRGGNCINTNGSFLCECPPGLELSPSKDACKDIDECSRTSGICSNGVCENLLGTYQCTCNDGYVQAHNKTHCADIDECHEIEPCQDICHNTPGSYTCACGSGYALQADLSSCSDVDECKDNYRICNGGKCINNEGSYNCECNEGLETGKNGKSCLDINECVLKADICGNGVCTNKHGSYECLCDEGYSVKPDGPNVCTDDNECELVYDCDVNADCINIPGSYQCRCHDGFTGNGISCRDINECLINNGGCDQNAQCLNEVGSYKCVCDTGFKGDGFRCEDIDECENDNSLCDNGQCINLPGSFQCECEMGFMHPSETDEQSCKDIDECTMFHNLCVHGTCENTHGMFGCECDPGYKLDASGGNCTDIDECESPASCQYGKCINREGTSDCICPPHYELNEEENGCIDRRTSRCYLSVDPFRRCSNHISDYGTKAACCCSVGAAWGPQCELCPLKGTAEYDQICPGGPGFKPNNISAVLVDIDECAEHPELCENGHCANTYGSFICNCNDGYELAPSGKTCVDKNECLDNRCPIGECINEPGSFYCLCPPGYVQMPGRKDCVDMRKDTCYLNFQVFHCSNPLTQTLTKKLCCCSMGQGWGDQCEPCPAASTNEYYQLCGTNAGKLVDPFTNRTEDNDECAIMPTLCGKNGECINTPGSFVCHCYPGFVYDHLSHECIDINECAKVPGPCEGNAQCFNTEGSFRCECPEGYRHGPTQMDCVDIDECATNRYHICTNGECKNLKGSFQCICNAGYQLSQSRDVCVDIDECLRPGICDDGTCFNVMGSYKCQCKVGYMLNHNNQCVDIDECHMMSLCRHGRCRNNIGSFTCECADGYVLDEDGRHCRDVNECFEIPGACPPPGLCTNLMGSFTCNCPDGYEMSKVTHACEDIDECESPKYCQNGLCQNIMGAGYCTCPDGFMLDKARVVCIDMREEKCYDHFFNRKCSSARNGTAVTKQKCCCSHGAAWGRSCEECPREGSDDFNKLCPEGPGRTSTGDINECEQMPDVCENGVCINTDGSFRCSCHDGYVLDNSGEKCVDDNECVSRWGICGNGTCTNIPGGFECQCFRGYSPGAAQVCEDIDECLDIGYQCNFRCSNVPGSYRCICPFGFKLAPDGRHCEDVDECQTQANNCKFQCKNLIGSFDCICPEGYYEVNGTNDCRDVNECLENQFICGSHGRCFNTPGAYKCECHDGFEASYDRKSCIDRRQGTCFRQLMHGRCVPQPRDHPNNVTKAECCCSMGQAWGPSCDLCPNKYSEEYNNLCLESGYIATGDDINECTIMPNLCRNGECINTAGSYRCRCSKGYQSDNTGHICYDINECELSPSPCKGNCHNTEGSFQCTCPSGYRLLLDGVTCIDIDECATGQSTCQHNCINTEGSYECSCRTGFKEVGDECHDINECKLGKCPKPGRCVNTMGSFKCICPRGYKLDAGGNYCSDSDECQDDSNCEEGCQNMIGGYKCGCPEGYQSHPYYNHCIDVNECLGTPCGSSGSCVNSIGSFSCNCASGFQYDTGMKLCMAMSSGCAGSPCSFGCSPTSAGGFSCGCPQGYQMISYGHCLATIGGYGPDIGNVPTYPIGGAAQQGSQPLDEKIVGTEGCFSCRANARQRRDSKHRSDTSAYRDYVNGLLRRSPGQSPSRSGRVRRHHHTEYLEIKVSLAQTKHKTRLVKLLPAIKGDVEYTIVKGNEKNKFQLKKKQDVWILHFRRRLKQPGVFELTLQGKPTEEGVNEHLEKPLILHVRLVVTE